MAEQEQGNKLKLAVYWGASCGGCDISILEIGERILDVAAAADIVFWPCVADFKYQDVRGYPDRHIDLCLFNGAVRSDENREIAQLLRAKSKILVAFGSCAHEGCIPGLANFSTREELFARVYVDNPTTDNPEARFPATHSTVDGVDLELPAMWDSVHALSSVADVDFTIPGCPPTAETVWGALSAVLAGDLPEAGSLLGAGQKAVCDECRFVKKETPIERFVRPHLVRLDPDDEQCLLERGLVCMGPATRSGCGASCPEANLACRGCYGPAGDVYDQGAKMVAALGSMVAAGSEAEIQERIAQIVDPAGTFYRFGLPHSFLRRKKTARSGQ